MDKKTMEEKTANLAQRLKEKLAGSPEHVHADETATELVESQLDAVSGGSSHGSHESVITDVQNPTGDKK
jgi:hypothetical protein